MKVENLNPPTFQTLNTSVYNLCWFAFQGLNTSSVAVQRPRPSGVQGKLPQEKLNTSIAGAMPEIKTVDRTEVREEDTMYTTRNFKTKKALKDAVAAGEKISVYQPGPFGGSANTQNGVCYLEGPHYPEPHKWYAEATLKDGVVIKVK